MAQRTFQMNEKDLQKIVKRKGYGVAASGAGIKGTLRAWASLSKDSGSGEEHDLEPDSRHEQMGAKKLQISYTGEVQVRITFYRRRLADYSRAISEKALVDCLRHVGFIRDDKEGEIRLEDGGQHKVGSDEEERTEIELSYPEVDFDNLWVTDKRIDGR